MVDFTASALQMTGETTVYNQGCFTAAVTSIKTNGLFTRGIQLGLCTLITKVIHIQMWPACSKNSRGLACTLMPTNKTLHVCCENGMTKTVLC